MKPGDPITEDQPVGTVVADAEGDLWIRDDEGWTWNVKEEVRTVQEFDELLRGWQPLTLISAALSVELASDGQPDTDLRAMALDMAIQSYADEANPAELVAAARTFEAYLRGEQA